MPSVWSRLLPSTLRKHLALRVHRDAVARRDRALESPRRAQQEALQQILQLNQQSEFGRTHGFSSVDNLEQYMSHVPLRGHGEYSPFLERQAESGDILVTEAIATLIEYAEPNATAFPLTAAGLEQWQWWEALLQEYALRRGRGVVNGVWLNLHPLRPKPQADEEEEGLPLGERWDLLGTARAGAAHDPLPPALWEIGDEDDRYYLLLRLALDQPLRVLRAENPGTLSILADHLERQADRLLEHLASGIVQARGSYAALPSSLSASPERAKELARLRRAHGQLEPHHVWPELTMLICQTNGAARAAAERLPDRYGDVLCVDPGLIVAGAPLSMATNAGCPGGWALLHGQVIEFQAAGAPLTAPTESPFELRIGERYTPIISCHNGLYRYRSGRLVEIADVDEQGTPRLVPAGHREAEVEIESALMVEREVRGAQREACRALDVVPRQQCCFVERMENLPEGGGEAADRPIWSRLFSREPARPLDPETPHLCWVVEPTEPLSTEEGGKLLAHFEAALRQKSSTFAALRGEQTLGVALLILRRGSFARRKHGRLADGLPGAHAPLAALLETPLQLESDEIDRRIT